jgi:hypothetical protein
MDIWEIQQDLEGREEVFQRYFSGNSPVTNPQQGELRDYYNVVQRFLGHPEAASDLASQMEVRRDQTIRLLFWSLVTPKFGEAYKNLLQPGYEAAGMTMPDWKKLTRQQFVLHIEEFLQKAAGDSKATESIRLMIGLRDLDPLIVLTAWV